MQVLAPREEFEQSEAIRGAISPWRWMRGTIDKRADGLLPFVALVEVIAFKIVAAGETEKGRMKSGQFLH